MCSFQPVFRLRIPTDIRIHCEAVQQQRLQHLTGRIWLPVRIQRLLLHMQDQALRFQALPVEVRGMSVSFREDNLIRIRHLQEGLPFR